MWPLNHSFTQRDEANSKCTAMKSVMTLHQQVAPKTSVLIPFSWRLLLSSLSHSTYRGVRGSGGGGQEKYTSSNTCTVRHVCSMSHVVQTYLSVVSVRSVSAPRWRKREKLFKNIFIYIQRLYLLIYKTIIIKLIVLFRKGDEVRQKSSLRTVVITSVS